MASKLCGCSKRSRHDRSSVYVLSDELTTRPPTTMSQSEPATRDQLRRLATPSGTSVTEHVERYVAGGGSAVTVSVRQHHHHHHHRHGRYGRQRRDENDDDEVARQLSNYDDVLDQYLHAAIATQDANISSQSGKVQTLSTCE